MKRKLTGLSNLLVGAQKRKKKKKSSNDTGYFKGQLGTATRVWKSRAFYIQWRAQMPSHWVYFRSWGVNELCPIIKLIHTVLLVHIYLCSFNEKTLFFHNNSDYCRTNKISTYFSKIKFYINIQINNTNCCPFSYSNIIINFKLI